MKMRVRNPLSNRRSAPRRTRSGEGHRRSASAADVAPPTEAPASPTVDRRSADRLAADRRERLVRESGGPQDEAHYACSCGYQFSATVGTTVVCPNCGAEQAW
jgi:hypothetical protein